MKRTKLLPLLLSALLLLSASGCRPEEAPSQSGGAISSVSSSTSSSGIPAPHDEVLPIDLAVLSGPTGVGAAYLMEYYAPEHVPADSPISVSSVVVTENSEATALLSNGEADIAAVATNVASNFYHKTDGSIQMLAVNTMGVLYILEKGDSIQSMADLRGKTIYASGKGNTPEYALNYVLTQNGIDPASDVTIEWKSEQAECLSALMAEENTIAMLPQPFVTSAMSQVEGLRVALDMNEEWQKVAGSKLVTGVLVVRKDAVENDPEAFAAFMDGYAASVEAANSDLEGTAALCEQYGVVAKAALAQKALPQCNIVFETGDEMKTDLETYFKVLYAADPASVGGALPADDFYYAG